ncbi:hypothetical protein Q0Z83_064430 [Actinoplanes sichuanensis]|uniref:Nucleotidyl transferase AbiEii/AbiGii toxin family protein n=1 Tax=Actinoplanes sichuanensis TaxID=512349 RepID=A0ABW4AMF9_9ACTN|nr:nucleotidyl transferase AbiEii/AbiGii toxin family protein [Actinoplanes sichuanensis]BEL08252.1 hypothetical protein Q0Z83_064430 [Actinoplanes sichuanensis]
MRHHLTAGSYSPLHLAGMAAEHGVEFREIELDHGLHPSQSTIIVTGGRSRIADWEKRIHPVRRRTLAAAETGDRNFEHHIEMRSAPARVADLVRLEEIVEEHGAGLCRDPRRLVVQRCPGSSGEAATALERLLADLRAAGHEWASVERWHIVADDNPGWDAGWLPPDEVRRDPFHRNKLIRRGMGYHPPVFKPVPPGPGVEQRFVFDPALKQFDDAYRPGEPEFADPRISEHWRAAQQAAMNHLLTGVDRDHLVLRGSALMPAWAGDAARRPGDLDFVVTPRSITSGSRQARELLDGIRAAASGGGLRPDETAESAIWTYERADGRRLVIPFSAPGVPDGSIQIDVVFGEHLPIDPKPIMLPGVGTPVLAATAELSLAWKLLWLATDRYPQGKDLYDAVLLAEYTTVDVELVRELLLPELGHEAAEFSAATPLTWTDIDWDNFTDEYPTVEGASRHWLRRLALALDRSS